MSRDHSKQEVSLLSNKPKLFLNLILEEAGFYWLTHSFYDAISVSYTGPRELAEFSIVNIKNRVKIIKYFYVVSFEFKYMLEFVLHI